MPYIDQPKYQSIEFFSKFRIILWDPCKIIIVCLCKLNRNGLSESNFAGVIFSLSYVSGGTHQQEEGVEKYAQKTIEIDSESDKLAHANATGKQRSRKYINFLKHGLLQNPEICRVTNVLIIGMHK